MCLAIYWNLWLGYLARKSFTDPPDLSRLISFLVSSMPIVPTHCSSFCFIKLFIDATGFCGSSK